MNVYAELDDLYRWVQATRTSTGLVGYSMRLHTLLESVGIPNTYRPRLNVGEYQQLEIQIGYGMSFTLAVGVHCMVLGRRHVTVRSLIDCIRVQVTAAREWYARLQCKGCYYSDGTRYCGMGLVPVVDCNHKRVDGGL